jgi:hypothetical protein
LISKLIDSDKDSNIKGHALSMSTVIPKLYYSHDIGCNIPVWEIITEKGQYIYYERQHKEGYLPIGLLSVLEIPGSTILVCDVVKSKGNNTILIYKAKDGYKAPRSWYKRDPRSKSNQSNRAIQSNQSRQQLKTTPEDESPQIDRKFNWCGTEDPMISDSD